jgi:DNA repair exonuclease SbcCD nuclease subunit
MKAILISDLHLGLSTFGATNPINGLNTRAEDGLNALNEVYDYAIKNKINYVLCSGDVFNTKSPSQNVINALFKILKKGSDSNINTYILSGNHDNSAFFERATSLDLLSLIDMSNVFATRGDIYKDYGDFQIISPNYWHTAEELEVILNDLAKQADWNRPVILVAHLELAGSLPAFTESLQTVPLEMLIKYPFTFCQLGHIHTDKIFHKDPLTFYVGSLVKCSFTEENNHSGFIVIDFDKKVNSFKRIPVNCLKMLTIKGTPKEIFNQLEEKIPEDFKNTIVRIMADETSGQTTDEKFLKDKFAKSFKYILKKENNKIQHNQIDTTNLLDIKEYAKKYFENHKRKDDLLNMIEEFRLKDEEKNIV